MANNYLGDALDDSVVAVNAESEEEGTTEAGTAETDTCMVQYDEHAKKVLADISVLSRILKYSVREFEDMSVEEIKACIEGEPEISMIPVEPSKKKRSQNEAITGTNTEDNSPGEGTVYYDIRFYVLLPGKERVKIHIDIEPQRKYNPGYSVLSRAVYYVARMISAQKGKEFIKSDYDSIKKVYSIWICMDVPEDVQNNITRYEMQQTCLKGHEIEDDRFDLMSIVLICLGKLEEAGHPLLGMLDTLFSCKISTAEKKTRLKTEYAIETSTDLEKELVKMGNLGNWVYDCGVRENARDNAEKFFQNGASYELVRASISEEVLSDEELHQIYDSVMCVV